MYVQAKVNMVYNVYTTKRREALIENKIDTFPSKRLPTTFRISNSK